jgi:hypothetical protein
LHAEKELFQLLLCRGNRPELCKWYLERSMLGLGLRNIPHSLKPESATEIVPRSFSIFSKLLDRIVRSNQGAQSSSSNATTRRASGKANH